MLLADVIVVQCQCFLSRTVHHPLSSVCKPLGFLHELAIRHCPPSPELSSAMACLLPFPTLQKLKKARFRNQPFPTKSQPGQSPFVEISIHRILIDTELLCDPLGVTIV